MGHPLIEAVLNEAYLAEYGLETWQQSTLNFLGFMRLNRQSKFEPFGVSDERFHLADGNDGIVTRPVSEAARPDPHRRQADASGAPRLRGATGSTSTDLTGGNRRRGGARRAVHVLRQVTLDASLALSPEQAERRLRRSATAPTRRRWSPSPAVRGRSCTDPTAASTAICRTVRRRGKPTAARATRFGIITDYASGDRGDALRTYQVQSQVAAFLTDFDTVLPGTEGARAPGAAASTWRTSSTGRRILSRAVVHLLSARAVHARSPGSRVRRPGCSSSPASTRTRSTPGRASWKAPASAASAPPTRSWPTSRTASSDMSLLISRRELLCDVAGRGCDASLRAGRRA